MFWRCSLTQLRRPNLTCRPRRSAQTSRDVPYCYRYKNFHFPICLFSIGQIHVFLILSSSLMQMLFLSKINLGTLNRPLASCPLVSGLTCDLMRKMVRASVLMNASPGAIHEQVCSDKFQLIKSYHMCNRPNT